MKPSDHPEFFRLPPPEGRSRESTIRLDTQGRFRHDGKVVEHAPMARAFASWIARHPDDGRYILNNGWDWTYFTVEDVPFFVESVFEREGRPWLRLSDGSEECVEPSGVRLGERDAVYARVKRGEFEARFHPSAQLSLSPWLEDAGGGTVALAIGGARHRLPSAGQAEAAEPGTKP